MHTYVKPLIINEDLELRLPHPEMAAEKFKLVDRQRPYLREWLTWVDLTELQTASENYLKECMLFNEGGQRLTYLIFHRNQIAGSIGLVSIDKPNRLAEIGYWLSEDQQGQGIMTACCRRLVDHVFSSMPIYRLEIKAASGNVASLGVPRRLNFVHEATLAGAHWLYDEVHDLELYRMLCKDWTG